MHTRRIIAFCCLCLVFFATALLGQRSQDSKDGAQQVVEKYRAAASKNWEKAIQGLEKLDKEEEYSEKAILFTGSSSIRRWNSIAKDMEPWEPIRRGYGGARFSDLAVFIDRIVAAHQAQAVVVFVGNDIAGSEKDKTPAEATELYRYIVERIRKKLPSAPIFCIGVTPTSSRFDIWPRVQIMNRMLREYSESDDGLHYIDTAQAYLNESGRPRDELFVKDLLHLNADGYQLWSKLIKAELKKVLKDEN
ncbi:MAG: GDSL-type esterase/lipase family protein [Planctomycetota bacterium]|nr:GDSL-type esterase/lipase family protein [Planctomycetota bacterium]